MIHRDFRPDQAAAIDLPRYDADLFIDQVMLLADVYVPAALGRDRTAAERAELEQAWRATGPRRGGNRHVADAPGLSRGQPDAAARPPRSRRLRPARFPERRPWPHQLRSGVAAGRRPPRRSHAARLRDARPLPEQFPDLDRDAFRRSYAVLGAVRHTRIVAVFARLHLSHGRSEYLQHLPRVWRLLEAKLAEPALAPVRDWFDRTLPPASPRPSVPFESN